MPIVLVAAAVVLTAFRAVVGPIFFVVGAGGNVPAPVLALGRLRRVVLLGAPCRACARLADDVQRGHHPERSGLFHLPVVFGFCRWGSDLCSSPVRRQSRRR